jgi:CRP-like cAMP-binding protein
MENEISPEIHIFDKADNLETFQRGNTIFKAGEPRQYMNVVVDGEIDIYLHNVLVETVRQCGIFGEMALIDKVVRIATAVARTDCKLALIDENRFNFLIQQTPFFAIQVMRVLAKRLRKMNSLLQQDPKVKDDCL